MRTYGYDYSYAISSTEVNKILTSNLQGKNLPLKYQGTDSTSGATINLDATMNPWQLVKGGQNTLLRLSLPLANGSLTVSSPLNKNYDLSGVTIIVEVSLGWLGASTALSNQGSGSNTKLAFTPVQSTDKTQPGYVSVVNILDPLHKLDTIGLGLLRNYTINVLVANKAEINLIFADVFPHPNNVSSWLQPSQWVYYYSTGASYDALCFLCVLAGRSLPSAPAFDSSALSTNSNSVILISQETFFTHVVLPSIQSTFKNGNFKVTTSPDETAQITNQGDFSIKTKKGDITAKSFKLTTSDQGNGLKIKTSGGGPLKFFFGVGKLPNASYSWSCENTNPLNYSNDKITFAEDKKPKLSHNQTMHWYDWVILVAVGITSLPGLVSFIVDSIEDFSDDVNEIGIGNINTNMGKATSNSVVNLANLLEWSTTGGQKFTPNSAGLNGALFVNGTIQ